MDHDEELTDNHGVTKARSAYTYFMIANGGNVKESDGTQGSVLAALANKWKTLPAEEKEKYNEMARKDRLRYEEESRKRDEEVLRQQEERRKANQATETSTRMRGSTLANTDASTLRVENKRTREISEKEKEMKESRRQAKEAESSAIKKQLDQVKEEKARQAEARLKYLLSQSDIFAHFGKSASSSSSTSNNKGETASSKQVTTATETTSKEKRNHRSSAAASEEELDEDEKAIMKEIGEDDDNETNETNETSHNTVLRKQPSYVSGGEMRPYQVDGLNWMIKLQENGINGILADEMGLGKTLQSISILAYTYEYKKVAGPHLIMVPKSTLSNWCNEFQRWAPKFRVLRFHGSKEERQEIVKEHFQAVSRHEDRDWDVVVTTYEVVNLEKGALTKIAWRYLIIDEAHRLKNEASQFSQTVRLLTTQHRLLLTGTPLQNNLHELWALLNFLLPDVFASSEQFDEWFNLDISDTEAKQRIISQLHKLLRPFMLRRLKVDVEKSLPPKSETILFTGMSAMQKQLYRQILMRDIDTINTAAASGGSNQQSRTAILNIVMQLRKCCNHPYLFPNQEDRSLDPLGDHLIKNCGKMALLDKLLAKLYQRGHRVLVFSQMTRMLDILEDYLISQGYKYCRIDGNTTYEEREDRIADFNREGSDKFLFILSTRAGGLGINLQTADTVILYDSDWNPQADLQAQDRAHRIGQKRPVQVFRLVTDDSVEVKVVERAQQKLKLDAMVVQQGRLQEKEKKMSKQDLLDTLRFGADKIFRSKESTITDADIDLILEEGRKRTEEMNEKLQVAEKGDMYDFRLDGGMATQVFEGKDYSDKTTRANELSNYLFLDPGKRERKTIVNYSETQPRPPLSEEAEKKQKLPRHLRLNKMEDWQFFNKTRLNELQNEEIRLFDQLVERGEVPQSGAIGKLILLPPELHEEKLQLISEGFGDWTKVHFNNFVRASAKHGRSEYEKIAKDVGRPVEETKKYAETFWSRGAKDLTTSEWERAIKQIEKGEKRLEEISRLTEATARLIAMFNDPWEELTFRNVGNVNRIFTAVEDRFLLCLTHLHGYGSWDQIRNSIRRCERFRFDFYLQSCSAETLGRRCEGLMRAAERELLEIERKRQSSGNTTSTSNGQDSANAISVSTKPLSASEAMSQRVLDLTNKIGEEAKRLAAVRAQLQKAKTETATTSTSNKGSSSHTTTANAEKTANKDSNKEGRGNVLFPESANKMEVDDSKDNKESKEKKKPAGVRGAVVVVPESLCPSLCKLLVASGPDGINKVIDKFIERYPDFSKRQVELKITEMAVKEKREEDNIKVWHIKPEFEHFLHMEEKPYVSKSTPAKRKASEANLEEDQEVNSPSGSVLKEPKKAKSAFGLFVKAKRPEAEAKLGPDASKTDALKDLLTKMWEEADSTTRKHYEKKEQEDRDRYEKEMSLWQKSRKASEGNNNHSSSSSAVKKPKLNN